MVVWGVCGSKVGAGFGMGLRGGQYPISLRNYAYKPTFSSLLFYLCFLCTVNCRLIVPG